MNQQPTGRNPLQRRTLLKAGGAALALASIPASRLCSEERASAPTFQTDNQAWQTAYSKALAILAGNVRVLPRFPDPVLIEGAQYAGVWQECGPHEALVYRHFRPDVARNTHLVFFRLQKEDGQLPANNKLSETGFGQIQMVVPIAATAWELAEATGDDELLRVAYTACARWDAWLAQYRNTRGTGLTEGFCTYDTGHDNSPRWAGMPNQCPGKDARVCPPVASLPRLCPDLSATVYGGRRALAAMARALGKSAQADRWTESAETMRQLILQRLYTVAETAFYDLDRQDRSVRIDCDILSRVCGEHVPDQMLFDRLWNEQLGNPKRFWAPYPLPSVALDDPLFVRPIEHNSWGGPSQALTALRAGRWMEHYGRAAEFAHMMQRWCEALVQDGTFRQQMDPLTGEFTAGDEPGYSPACLVLVDYTWRLCGVREDDGSLMWNVRPDLSAAQGAQFRLQTRAGLEAAMHYSGEGAELRLGGRLLARVRGTARLLTSPDGRPRGVLGISTTAQEVKLSLSGAPDRHLSVHPNTYIPLRTHG